MNRKQIRSQMRVPEVEEGDGLFNRILIRFISMVSGMRLPDAARIVMYHKKFYGDPMSVWTHAAMRGKSGWTVGERELMAAMTAKWNSCPFCIQAHGAIASLELGNSMVNSILADKEQHLLSEKLQTTLVFLEKLTQYPDKIDKADIRAVFEKGVTHDDLEDAIAVTSLFGIMTRCANAFNFATLTKSDSEKAAKRMLAQGYVFGKKGIPERPNHSSMAEILRQRIFDGNGITNNSLRQAVGNRAIGGQPIEEPYDEIALQIGEASYKITDEMVMNLIRKSGSNKAAFELMISAAVSGGLYRWNMANKILRDISLTHT